MLPWLVSLLIAGPTALAGGPVVHHAHEPRTECIANVMARHPTPLVPCRQRKRLIACASIAQRLVGHRMVRARQIAHRYGCTVRVVRRNGDSLFIRADLQPNRIDVSVKHGRIVRIVEIG